ncbi:hypothetical protein [Flavobacterium hungaricum]|uniref:Uncharacterized protein n=1 Tax=Flavobacterium hungaricum TaxID=2082725 RepID=A0ABR9TDV8_9FLAO|nr:hypothetical protein [Flavobacterium hungaricum]MBE8723533.1 hypothetical protein [Flavobacterium hungaricum]
MTEKTLLHRQVHPNWIQNNIVSLQVFATSQVFSPTPKDEGHLSVYNGEKFSAEESYTHFLCNPECSSVGTLSVSISEVDEVGDLSSVENDYPFDGHCYIDFNGVSTKGALKKKSQKLRDLAMERGWTYKV